MQFPYLVADIGGTNTRLARLDPGTRDRAPALGPVRRVRNADVADFETLLRQEAPIRALCLACAGPVLGDQVRLTNHPWTLSAPALRRALPGLDRVLLLNDLQAMGHALASPPPGLSLLAGQPDPEGPRLMVNLGTGFNVAVWRAGQPVPAAEAGHALMPFRADEAAILAHLGPRAPVIEDLLSGRGLESLYRLTSGGLTRAAPDITLSQDRAAREARLLITRFLGRVLADLALAHLPTGGIYLAGSVAVGLRHDLASPSLRSEFHRDGPYMALLDRLPLTLLDDPDLPLFGAAQHLLDACLHDCADFPDSRV